MNQRFRQSAVAVIILVNLSGFTVLESLFSPSADIWLKWEANNVASTQTIDHAPWAKFLKTYIKLGSDGVNRVAYGAVTEADKKGLHEYLESLRRVNVAILNQDEQLAFWINLYNALTVRMVVHFYPIDSIQNVKLSGGLFGGSGPWDKKLIRIDGEMISLNDIKHRILRPIWRDPRIHYAVNCASIGCPNLAATPYTAATVNAMLNKAANAYINSPRGVRFTSDGLVLSKIYAWFSDDFGGNEALVLDHIARHASSDTEVKIMESTDIAAYEYDWSLNDARK